jgi:quinol monooxygenase YgiN
LYYFIHYPKPDKEHLLAKEMARFGDLVQKQPGVIFVNAFKDEKNGTLMAMSVWESQAALESAMPAMREALKDVPFADWEAQPREMHVLNSLAF